MSACVCGEGGVRAVCMCVCERIVSVRASGCAYVYVCIVPYLPVDFNDFSRGFVESPEINSPARGAVSCSVANE